MSQIILLKVIKIKMMVLGTSSKLKNLETRIRHSKSLKKFGKGKQVSRSREGCRRKAADFQGDHSLDVSSKSTDAFIKSHKGSHSNQMSAQSKVHLFQMSNFST